MVIQLGVDHSEDSLLARNQIPIIDLSHISTAAAAGASAPTCCMTMRKIASQLERCLAEKGLALLVNHGIPQHKLSLLYKQMEMFRKCRSIDNETYQYCSEEIISHALNNTNYSPSSFAPYSDCYKEEYHSLDAGWLNEKLAAGNEQEGHNQLCNLLNSLAEDFRHVSVTMLYALAMVLGDLDTDVFVNAHEGKSRNNLHVLYSVRQGRENATPDVVQFPRQDDLNTFTLLAQDPDSHLEIQISENKWMKVGHLPGAILFHAGKLLENWTDGRYKYKPYRVMTPEETLLQMRSGYVTMYNVYPESSSMIDPLLIQLSRVPENSNQTKPNHKRYMTLLAAVQHFQRHFKLQRICKILHITGGTRY